MFIVTSKVPLTDGVLTDVAFTVTVPLNTAVSKPVLLIVALSVVEPSVSVTDHVTDLMLAFVGLTSAIICNVPLSVVIVVASPVPFTLILLTVTTGLGGK